MGKGEQNSSCDEWGVVDTGQRDNESLSSVPWAMTTMVPSSSCGIPLFLFLSSSLHVSTSIAP